MCDNVLIINGPELIRSARRRAGLTQRGLARRARIPQPTIATIESGRQEPRYGTLTRLLRACGVELDYVPIAGMGVDRSLIRENLRLSATERALRATRASRAAAAFRGARRS